MQNLNKRNAATGNVKKIIIYTENIHFSSLRKWFVELDTEHCHASLPRGFSLGFKIGFCGLFAQNKACFTNFFRFFASFLI